MVGARKLRRMEKSARSNSKMWAEGCREDVLSPHIAPYADASARSFVAERDYVRRVQNEYHQLIPWRTPDDEEPPLPLREYDPHLIPVIEDLTDEEQALKSRTIAKKNEVSLVPSLVSKSRSNFVVQAIRRWLKYRAQKLKVAGTTAGMNVDKNPYTVLLAKLSGIPPAPIRARQGWQQLMKERYTDVIAPAVAAAWDEKVKKGLNPKDKNDAAFRADVARAAFGKLPKDEQNELLANAKGDKDAAVTAYKKALADIHTGSRTPEKRQA